MSRCPDCGREDYCVWPDSDCFHIGGKGTALNPLYVESILDPDTGNLITCSASGLLAQLPTAIRTPPACQAYNSTNQSVSDNSGIAVPLDSERYDNGSMHDNATKNSRITFTTAGVYICTFLCSWAGNVTGDRSAWIRANGKDYLGASQKKACNSASVETGHSVTVQELFAVGDYIEGIVKQDSGGALNLLATRYSPILSVRYRRGVPS